MAEGESTQSEGGGDASVASSSSASTQEDYSVDLLPFSTQLTPRVPDPVIPVQGDRAPSQSEVTESYLNGISRDDVNDNTNVDPSDQELIMDTSAPASPVIEENFSS
ncbi:hypothetical protein L1987_46450 [Smallanthus sonchifolius]|uniref:Uncharacterized protein n=1 Tax=Smallanthus sonchifolius TaxID=185202 RepID=A0ACB9FZQ3_9ASTR|nr:hypothetical protein L1987_46450 [Smallanthus sonchifolius]